MEIGDLIELGDIEFKNDDGGYGKAALKGVVRMAPPVEPYLSTRMRFVVHETYPGEMENIKTLQVIENGIWKDIPEVNDFDGIRP